MDLTIPGGKEKDVALADASDEAINWWLKRKAESNAADPDGRFAAFNAEWIEAAQTELARRGISGGSSLPSSRANVKEVATQSTAVSTSRKHATDIEPKPNAIQIVGESIAAGQSLMAALQRLSETCTLIAPTTAIDQLPEGCAVAISMVKVDTENDAYCLTGSKDCPKPDDHMGLGKSAIESIGAASGASWIPGLTGRADDGREPHYRHYVAWAEYMDLDGSIRRYNGECEIDLRDNSPQTLDIIRKAQKIKRDPAVQLAEARKFISRQCASKAMLVALRRPGLRHWYPRVILETKPFAVTKLVFHGRTQDPALKQVFAKVITERLLGATRQLFGSQQPPRHASPPVGTVPFDVLGERVDDTFG